MSDVVLHDDGASLLGFEPITPRAKEWFADNVRADPWQWLGPVCWCDRRLAETICEALLGDGFSIGG